MPKVTKKDFDTWDQELSSQSNKPDFDTWDQELSSKKSQEWPSFVTTPLNFINNLGGGVSQGLQSFVTKPLNLIGNVTNNATLKNISPISSPFYNPNTIPSALGIFAGETIPETAFAELGLASHFVSPFLNRIPKAGNFLNSALTSNKALDYAAIGGLTNPNNPIMGAAVSGVSGGGLNTIGNKILSKVERLKQEENMPSLQEEASSILQRIHPNKTLSKNENEQEAAHMIRNNYNNLRKQFSQRYQSIFEPFSDSGGNETLTTPNLSRQLQDHDEELAPLKNVLGSKKAAELQMMAKQGSPKDINKLQNMQSYIGKRSSELSTDLDGEKRRQGAEIEKIKEAILDDMENALNEKGLGNAFANVRNDYRLKIIPYMENKNIRDIIMSAPDKITNFDKLKEAFGSQAFHKEVANQGGNKLKNSIIFDALSPSISTNGKVDPKTLVRLYDKLGEQNKDHYITPETYNMVENLREKLIKKYPTEFTQEDRKIPDSIKTIGKDSLSALTSALVGASLGGLLGHPTAGSLLGTGLHPLIKGISEQNIPSRLLNSASKSDTIRNAAKAAKLLPFLIF